MWEKKNEFSKSVVKNIRWKDNAIKCFEFFYFRLWTCKVVLKITISVHCTVNVENGEILFDWFKKGLFKYKKQCLPNY